MRPISICGRRFGAFRAGSSRPSFSATGWTCRFGRSPRSWGAGRGRCAPTCRGPTRASGAPWEVSRMEIDQEIRRRLGATPPDIPAFRPNAGDVTRRARARRVRRSLGALAAGVLVIGGIGLPLVLLSGLGGSLSPVVSPSPPPSLVSPSPPAPAVHAVLGASIPIPSGAVDVAVEGGTVWVSGFGMLTRLDAG